ncbi:hypothetical protein [Fulvivirga ligni]|uniref:hypothetical protein n=1 Tax=Fulvivirga ligni TaxID=2904246 RepID=UPI001F325AEA|nr:hypothetical protein [Fulvivirga ligni]UII21377.1 hypothetical protein LVD16_26470 [Fulvivirga ligni]
MDQIKTILDFIANLYKEYELELIWAALILTVLRMAKDLSQGSLFSKHSIANNKETFLIDVGFYRHRLKDNWIHIITVLITLSSTITSFFSQDYHQLFLSLGTFLLIGVSVLNSCKFYIEIKNDSILLDSIKFKAKNIDRLEVWDNMITVHIEKKEQDIKLTYKAKDFELVKQMILKLKAFSSQHNITFEDHNFQYDLAQNEVARK